MRNKDIVAKAYISLSTDSTLLSKMGISTPTSVVLDDRIRRTKQLTNITDIKSRLSLWETEPDGTANERLKIRTFVVSIFVHNEEQNRLGTAFDIAEIVEADIKEMFRLSRLTRTPISSSKPRASKAFNLRTTYGWFKAEVRFEYNSIE